MLKSKKAKNPWRDWKPTHTCRVKDAAPMNKASIRGSVEFPWKLQEDEHQQRQRGDVNEEEEQI